MRIISCLCVLALSPFCEFENAKAQNTIVNSDSSVDNSTGANGRFAEDPLVGFAVVTLADIRHGLDSPQLRGTVIDRHFERVETATPLEKQHFLIAALKSEFPEVQRQAARELAALGILENIVRDMFDRVLAKRRSETS